MNVEELEAGKIYDCKLSGTQVLIFETDEQTVTGMDGKEVKVPAKKIGKIAIRLENGDLKYAFVDLHNGQMKGLSQVN